MNYKAICRRSCMFLLVALILLELFAVCLSVPSSAASSSYSGVLDDLKKDPEFNVDDYPVNIADYSVQLVTIAEGDNGELFVYVYQPARIVQELRATYINMSLQNKTERELTYNLYSLTWLNSDGVFAKYLVNDFKVSNDAYRYYSVASILRAFVSDLDDPSSATDDTKNHVAFSVGRYYCAYNYNESLVYECDKIHVVDIDILSVGFVRYREGYKGYTDKTDAHFVGFSVTNFDVDKIFDATIYYTYQEYTKSASLSGVEEEYTDPISIEKDICSIDQPGDSIGSTKGDGLLGVKYEWERIVTKAEFDEQMVEFKVQDAQFIKGNLENAQFVFQFLETSYTVNSVSGGTTLYNSTKVTNVGVLRLHFLVGQKVYNLGAVSDLVSDDGLPDGEVGIKENYEKLFEKYWKKLVPILGGIVAFILIIFFFGPITTVVKVIFNVIKFILSLLFWVISLPFKLLSRHKRE